MIINIVCNKIRSTTAHILFNWKITSIPHQPTSMVSSLVFLLQFILASHFPRRIFAKNFSKMADDIHRFKTSSLVAISILTMVSLLIPKLLIYTWRSSLSIDYSVISLGCQNCKEIWRGKFFFEFWDDWIFRLISFVIGFGKPGKVTVFVSPLKRC